MSIDSLCVDGRAKGSHLPGRRESRREHEFYRYFEPIRQMTENGPTFCDVRDVQAREQHQPFSCPDKTLTAFCQLGALRLNVRRCLLFFFDVNNAYVMAEATKSLSLEDDSSHDPDDQLWLGHAAIPRNIACCEVTINLPALLASSATLESNRESVFVVNDLAENPQTQNQPYVTSFPFGKFYAGVPITSPAGINIGAYCVLGDHPRDGISGKDILFMRDMSRTVMTHLETLRARAERQRATHMVTGLGAFVQGSSDSRRWERRIAKRKARKDTSTSLERSSLPTRKSHHIIKHRVPDALTDATDVPAHDPGKSPQPGYFDEKTVKAQTEAEKLTSGSGLPPPRSGEAVSQVTSASPSPLSAANLQSCTATGTESPTPLDSGHMQPVGLSDSRAGSVRYESSETVAAQHTPELSSTPRSNGARPPLQKTDSNPNIKSAYQRASEIMCESLSVDGVAFVDASVGTFGGLADVAVEAVGSTEISTCDESDWTTAQSQTPSFEEETPKPCHVLGCAASVRDGKIGALEGQHAKKLTETFLRTLLRRHPYGKIWTFDRFGVTHSEDALSSDPEELSGPGAHQRQHRLQERRRDGEKLQAMFPGARSVAVHGIRDQHHRRFTAGCLLWSFDPMRVLTTDTEMNFVAAFCDIIVGENRRVEVQRSDKAKSDFISSISHELRSPLHGILGSTEVLKECKLDSMATALVEQADSCGRTLLDIIDHLLDFANLKGQPLGQGAVRSSRIGRKLSTRESRISNLGDLRDLELTVALDDVTEETLEAAVYSFFSKKGVEDRSRVSVVLDVDRSADISWYCQLAPGGWRRICVNLVDNALKYTLAGYVRVSLQQKPRNGSRRRFDAVLTIADSGQGMSRTFLEDDLFRDFTQEDTLAYGMGLGMNMVGRIVHAMGGQIKVTSDQKGAGTCVVVTVPLERSQPTQGCNSIADHTIQTASFKDLPVGIIRDEARRPSMMDRGEQLEATASTLAIASIEKTCEYLGLQARTGSWTDCNSISLNFMLEKDFEYQVQSMQKASGANSGIPISVVPSVVICKHNPSAQTLKEPWRNDPHYHGVVVEYIASPCGIRAISRAISAALSRHKESEEKTAAQLYGDSSQELLELPTRAKFPYTTEDLTGHLSDILDGNRTLPIGKPASPPLGQPKTSEMQPLPLPPLDRIQSAFAPQQQISHPISIAAAPIDPTANGPILLLVDDNKVNLQLLVAYAKKRKYPYLTATDGSLAINAYQKAHENSVLPSAATSDANSPGRPSIVLMDINMPVMDGYVSAQHIRTYEKKCQLPASKIIALTALSSAAAHKEAFGSGFDIFMTKPVKLKDLTEIIEKGR